MSWQTAPVPQLLELFWTSIRYKQLFIDLIFFCLGCVWYVEGHQCRNYELNQTAEIISFYHDKRTGTRKSVYYMLILKFGNRV